MDYLSSLPNKVVFLSVRVLLLFPVELSLTCAKSPFLTLMGKTQIAFASTYCSSTVTCATLFGLPGKNWVELIGTCDAVDTYLIPFQYALYLTYCTALQSTLIVVEKYFTQMLQWKISITYKWDLF